MSKQNPWTFAFRPLPKCFTFVLIKQLRTIDAENGRRRRQTTSSSLFVCKSSAFVFARLSVFAVACTKITIFHCSKKPLDWSEMSKIKGAKRLSSLIPCSCHMHASTEKFSVRVCIFFNFYARQQNASRVLVMAWSSVRLSVCHTLQLYQNGAS